MPACEENTLKCFDRYDVTKLLLIENSNELSDQVKQMIHRSAIQYNRDDLTIVTWNSSLVIEPSGILDVCEIIEFALCQVLEMRFYDFVLEKKLTTLYNELALSQKHLLFTNKAEKLIQEVSRYYVEITETVESVENSLKVIGDFYLAQIFRVTSEKFRFQDWRESVDEKLKMLINIADLVNSNINARRSHLLEFIIVILIAVELIPFVLKLIQN